jgi:hypothetical protein
MYDKGGFWKKICQPLLATLPKANSDLKNVQPLLDTLPWPFLKFFSLFAESRGTLIQNNFFVKADPPYYPNTGEPRDFEKINWKSILG